MKCLITKQRINPKKLELAIEFRHNPTPREKKLWERLRKDQLEGYHFRRQQVIDGFIADLYCNPVKLVVEIDGRIYEYTKEQDKERERIIRNRGIRVIRFTNKEIETNIEDVLKRILSYCQDEIES
jgi:very-short-patch-repair endonuclease